jgi:hypothetical protein
VNSLQTVRWTTTGAVGLVQLSGAGRTFGPVPNTGSYTARFPSVGTMKTLTATIVGTAVTVTSNPFNVVASTAKEVQIIYPSNGTLYLEAGTSVPIIWNTQGYTAPTTWRVEFSTDDGMTWQVIAANAPAGSLAGGWTPPAIPTARLRVRVTNTVEPAISDLTPRMTLVASSPLLGMWLMGRSGDAVVMFRNTGGMGGTGFPRGGWLERVPFGSVLTAAPQVLQSGPENPAPRGLAMDATRVFYGDGVNLLATSATTSATSTAVLAQPTVRNLHLAGGKLYWDLGPGVRSINADGTGSMAVEVPTSELGCASFEHPYVVDDASLCYASCIGTGPAQVKCRPRTGGATTVAYTFAPNAFFGASSVLSIHDGFVYFSAGQQSVAGSSALFTDVRRAPLGGGGSEVVTTSYDNANSFSELTWTSRGEAVLGQYAGSPSRFMVVSIPPGPISAPLTPQLLSVSIVGGPGALLLTPVVDDVRRVVYLGATMGKLTVVGLPD